MKGKVPNLVRSSTRFSRLGTIQIQNKAENSPYFSANKET